jgi:PAS domain S-box-containing protein
MAAGVFPAHSHHGNPAENSNRSCVMKLDPESGIHTLSQTMLASAILRFTDEMAVMLDGQRKIIQMNGAFQKLCGEESGALIGNEIPGMAGELIGDLPINECLEDPDTPAPRSFIRFLQRDGKDRFFQIKMAPWPMEDGTRGVVILIEDTTALRSAELALAEAQHLFRDVLQNIQDVFYRTDLEGTLIMASDSFARMMGYDSIDECLGCNVGTTFYARPEDRAGLLAQLHKEGTVWDYEVMLKKRDGTPLPVALNSHLYFSPDGTELGIEGIFRDISSLKETQDCIHRNVRKIVEISGELLDFIDHPPQTRHALRARSECAIERIRD